MVHEAASVGFGRAADAYDRGRPSYPDEAVDLLWQALGLTPGAEVVDVGAGTGHLTAALAARGARVTAVEPVEAMLARLRERVPEATALAGTAEALPLAASTQDAVVAGQAFHWFANDAALSAFHRVLRPGRRLGLIWNRRRLDDPLQAALSDLLEPLRGDTPRHASGRWREPLERAGLFAPESAGEVEFVQELDPDRLLDRVASTSFVAALPDQPRRELLDRVRELAAPHSPVRLPYVCEAFVYTRRD